MARGNRDGKNGETWPELRARLPGEFRELGWDVKTHLTTGDRRPMKHPTASHPDEPITLIFRPMTVTLKTNLGGQSLGDVRGMLASEVAAIAVRIAHEPPDPIALAAADAVAAGRCEIRVVRDERGHVSFRRVCHREDGVPFASDGAWLEGGTLEDLRVALARYAVALERPVLDMAEVPGVFMPGERE